MANHASAKKRVKRNEKKAQVNMARMSRIRTFIKRIEQAIVSGDAKEAEEAYKIAQPEMHRGVSKGILRKKTVSRKLSRLSGRIKVLKESA